MFGSITRGTVIVAWLAALVAVAVAGVLSGVAITMDTGTLWLLACLVPPAIILMVWRGAPAPTVAEILHAVERRD
jgi:hypothetical protein